ncbi:MAG: AAA family ATPase [Kiritimatiellales bacterium]
MNEYISLVKESEQPDFEFRGESGDHLLVGPISTVNLLVGANNSRKSRFIRTLLKTESVALVDTELKNAFQKGLKKFDSLIANIGTDELLNVDTSEPSSFMGPAGWLAAFDKHKNSDKKAQFDVFWNSLRQANDRLIFDQATANSFKKSFIELFTDRERIQKTNKGVHIIPIIDLFELLHKNQHKTKRIGTTNRIAFDLISKFGNEFLEISQCFKTILETESTDRAIKKIFIPVLRGALPLGFGETKKPSYEDTTYKLYFGTKDENGKVNSYSINPDRQVHTGDKLYDQILTARNSNIEQRERFQQFQTFVSESFFRGKRVEIVAKPKDEEQTIMVFIEKEKERNLQDLGDGIQHLLILLYPIFMAEENTWIFIDEPELSLHPGFQNLFIDTILNNADLKQKNLRYFMTTHSNHFLSHALRAPQDVSVFSFSQYDAKQSTIRCVHGADPTLLDQLGVENASVYMANCSLWVEGVSDRRYLQAFLKAYCTASGEPDFKEGLDYTFFEYAGSNLKHYIFDRDGDDSSLINSFKNSNRIFLLADFDEGKEAKHQKLEKLAATSTTGFEYQTTGGREIENILPPQIYQDFIQDRRGQRETKFNADLKEYAQEQMGTFLKKITGEGSPEYGDGTLTTDYKNKLSQLVIENNYDWKIFSTSPELVRLTEAVYSFIKKHNSRN